MKVYERHMYKAFDKIYINWQKLPLSLLFYLKIYFICMFFISFLAQNSTKDFILALNPSTVGEFHFTVTDESVEGCTEFHGQNGNELEKTECN